MNMHKKRKQKKTNSRKLSTSANDEHPKRFVYVFIHHGCQFLMMWTAFSSLVCCLISLYAYASVSENEFAANVTAIVDLNATDTVINGDNVNREKLKSQTFEQLPEVLPPVEDDGVDSPESYIFTPSVAPATPHLFLSSSSVLDVISRPSPSQVPPPQPASSSSVPAPPPKGDLKGIVADAGSSTDSRDEAEKINPPKEEKLLIPPPVNHVVNQRDLKKIEDTIVGAPSIAEKPIQEGQDKKNSEILPDQKTKQEEYAKEKPVTDTIKDISIPDTTQSDADTPQPELSVNKLKTENEVSDIPLTTTESVVFVTTPSPVTMPKEGDVQATLDSGDNKEDDTDDRVNPKPVEKSEMLSFTEWKDKHDREKEIKEKEREEIEEVLGEGGLSVNKTDIVKKKKKTISNKKNYASPNCGAKVISANVEAQNSNAILKEDKDVYMLNPCNAQAWLVVELCERIQLDSIDFANFEMFSSTPELFSIHVSDRFPTREWVSVQEFQAKAGREVQTFQIKDKFYAKYIKFEVKKYLGKEHYCPLSLLRIFGMTEVEEFENEHEDDDSHGTDPDPEVTPKQTEEEANSGIFESAKKAMVGLVNNVAKTLTGQQAGHNQTGGGDDKTPNSSAIVTLLTQGDTFMEYFEDANFITSCIQRTLYSEYNTSLNPAGKFGMNYVFMKRMCPSLKLYQSVKKLRIKKDLLLRLNKNASTEKEKTEPVAPIPPPPLKVTTPTVEEVAVREDKKVSSGDRRATTPQEGVVVDKKIETTSSAAAEESLSDSFSSSLTATARDSPHDVATREQPESRTDTTCSKKAKPSIDITKLVELIPQPSFTDSKSSSESGTAATTALGVVIIETITKAPLVEVVEVSTTEVRKLNSSPAPVTKESVDVLEFRLNDTDTTSMVAEKVIEEKLPDKAIIPAEKELSEFKNVAVGEGEAKTVVKVVEGPPVSSLPSTSQEAKNTETGVKNLPPPPAESKTKEDAPETPPETSRQEEAKPPSTKATSDSTPASSMKDAVSVSQEQANDKSSQPRPNKQGQTIPGGMPGSKESIIVKLNAKMKALQLNLTMSMMYLEEMSERYRTAVEDVDKRHEKKTSSLSASLKSQQELIQQQAETINSLTKAIAELTLKLQNVTETFQKQHEMMTEKHVFWVFVEILLIIFFVTFCGRRAPSQQLVSKQQQQQQQTSENSEANRRKSEPTMSHSHQNGFVKKKRSHSSVENVYTVKPKPEMKHRVEDTEEMCKRTKRKKFSPPAAPPKPHTLRETSLSKTAGLLFYAGKGILSGLTGAFYGNKVNAMKVKPSRRADALIDHIHKPSVSKKEQKMMRRAKSIDLLTTVVEEVAPVTDFHQVTTLDQQDKKGTERPKSADAYLPCQATKKHRNNAHHQKSLGRFG